MADSGLWQKLLVSLPADIHLLFQGNSYFAAEEPAEVNRYGADLKVTEESSSAWD